MCLLPAAIRQGDALLSCLSSCNKRARLWSIQCYIFLIFCFINIGDVTIYNGPRVQCLSGVKCSKLQKAAMCLMQKTQELDKLCSTLSYSAVDCEFKVKESTK